MIVTIGAGSGAAWIVTFVVAEADPLAFVTVTTSVWAPAVSVLLVTPVVHAVAAAVSHLQVVDVASVATQVATIGEVQIVFGSGFVILTVGRFSAVNVLLAVALPAAFVAFTLNVCDPVVSVFAGGDAGHGFIQAVLSHQQMTLVAPVVV